MIRTLGNVDIELQMKRSECGCADEAPGPSGIQSLFQLSNDNHELREISAISSTGIGFWVNQNLSGADF